MAKWRHTLTYDRVIALRYQDHTMKAIRMAEICGVSKERIRQILKKAGLPTKNPPILLRCEKCGGIRSHNKSSKLCWDCYVNQMRTQFRTQFRCEVCGEYFYVRNSEVKQKAKYNLKPRFCGNKCKGKVLINILRQKRKEVEP